MSLDRTNDKIQSWLDGPFDEETKAQIKHLQKTDPTALTDAFFKDLSFGTGGMRGIMGIGTNRLNIYTIRMATQGLANYIKRASVNENLSVFIGYDVRNHSREFAVEAARVFAGNGIKALVSKDICPTPLVSFACRRYQCSAAVMITASHNPPQYNGYKVYWSDGCQVVPPHDEGIMNEVRKIHSPSQVFLSDVFEEIGSELDDAYLQELKKLQMLEAKPLKITYANLHGTGIRLIPKALSCWGYNDLSFVEEQKTPDGNFPNAPSPNPEEESALRLGIEQIKNQNRDLLIATDPDADRIGIATQQMKFTGNQTACLCLYHICQTLVQKGEFPENAAFIKSIVTTELFRKISEDFNGKCIDVLTGFKYIGEQIGIWDKTFDGYQYIFGAEESYGYLFGTFVRDKDSISSACLIAEVAAIAKEKGLTLSMLLEEIYQKYGVHREALINLKFSDGKDGLHQIKAIMTRLRNNPPQTINGKKVASYEDYLRAEYDLPPSDVLRFWLEDETKIVIRPSGTEPKVKIYLEVVGSSVQECDKRLEILKSSLSSFLSLDT
jgi:phosphomannomutase